MQTAIAVALLAFWAGLAVGGVWARAEAPTTPDDCPHGDGWDDCPVCRH